MVEQGVSDQSGKVRLEPQMRKASRLQRRFLIGVGFIFLLFCAVSAFLMYLHEKNLLVEATHRKSQLVMAVFEANRSYVREVLRPKMYEILGDEAFVLEAMSTSYVSRAIMDRFKESMPQYRYRRVALHARNPASEPTQFERELIMFFAEHPEQPNKRGIMVVDGRPCFVHSRPVYFKESCMHCHGDPADAPDALIELYGDQRGFGHRPGEIAGMNAVSIPVDIALAEIKERAFSVFWVGLICLAFLYFMVSFYFNRLVVHNLKDLLEVFRGNLRSEDELKLLKEAKGKDEIGELTTAAQVMATHLRDTRRELENYAQNLEKMVAERTRALEKSEQQLKEKVAARNRELQTMNVIAELITRSVSLADMIPQVLKQTLKTVPAQGIGLYLLHENPMRLELQCQENAEDLPQIFPVDFNREIALDDEPTDFPTSLCEAACGYMSFFLAGFGKRSGLNVPLCCRGRVLGVMAFVGVDFIEVTPEMEQLLYAIGQQIGITIESLQNTEQLVQSKELLQSVFDGITDMLVLMDRNLEIRMVNKAHLEYFGVTLEEVLNRPCRSRKVDACGSCPFAECQVEVAFATKKPMSEEVRSPKGEIFLVHYYPILNEEGEVESIVRYAKDITAQKRVEQQIHQTEKLASLGQLAAGIAHELNNPLGVILCHTDLLKRQLSDFPQALRDTATIEKHARSCHKTVSDMLQLARNQETVRRLAPVNRTIEEAVEMVAGQFRRARMEIELDLECELPLINIDPDKMKQVYINLLMNARQAAEDGGKIRISSRYLEKEKQIEIVFWDNGPGIPPELKDRIFDPFFTTKRTGEGTGLGLSVSYGIVKDHNGDIHVQSEPGRWTQFTILLPTDDHR